MLIHVLKLSIPDEDRVTGPVAYLALYITAMRRYHLNNSQYRSGSDLFKGTVYHISFTHHHVTFQTCRTCFLQWNTQKPKKLFVCKMKTSGDQKNFGSHRLSMHAQNTFFCVPLKKQKHFRFGTTKLIYLES